ncbi:putative nad dependent epimerase protein [Botrytis fragariae]|uniref:Putative nad dependent epimerase protein n=1 Tax=Botrytis fragariae TaxID=1964551 RepID=A0A8H6EGE3_9HELO|nr:putative nad dependent epimerase protein [Botrytis fragariae]KAF5871186.1 putative nad dependent epimerase protein [Botrytis fragariae]
MVIQSVLVTGGLGFVGSAIVDALHKKYPSSLIKILDISEDTFEWRTKSKYPPNISFVACDILDTEKLIGVLRYTKPDVVIHTAGIVPPLSERYNRRIEERILNVNVEGTRNILNATKNAGAKAEKIVLAANSTTFSTCILRPSVIMGPGDEQLIPPIHACIAKGETPFIIGSADNLWDITYVTNVADAHVLASENLHSHTATAAGEIFFIQNNTPITFRDFSIAVWKEFGHIPPYEVMIPQGLAWVAGLLAEAASWLTGSKESTLSRGSVNDACAIRYASGEKAKRILGYEAKVGLEEGIRLSCEAYKKRLASQEKKA